LAAAWFGVGLARGLAGWVGGGLFCGGCLSERKWVVREIVQPAPSAALKGVPFDKRQCQKFDHGKFVPFNTLRTQLASNPAVPGRGHNARNRRLYPAPGGTRPSGLYGVSPGGPRPWKLCCRLHVTRRHNHKWSSTSELDLAGAITMPIGHSLQELVRRNRSPMAMIHARTFQTIFKRGSVPPRCNLHSAILHKT
jgi:hypothetical protein